MKFLCLAYGDEAGWKALSKDEQQELLMHDAVIRDRGNLVSAVQTTVTSVRNPNLNLDVSDGPYPQHQLPLAGFSVIEADNIDEVVELVANTPCARAGGVIDIRPLWDLAKGGA
ncbi:MAG: YciI family protein [Tahibacter sp.]